MKDIVDQAEEVLGIEDSEKEKHEELKEKKAAGEETDLERKELEELESKAEDEPLEG
jgi:hypothetical protein